jgi:MFS family permease
MQKRVSPFLLPLIVFAQFAGTSLWFVVNAIMHDAEGNITSLIQFGFIAGTLIFSLLAVADRFPASIVFFISSVMAALANLLLTEVIDQQFWLYLLRFCTGFFLAGIYPVGMKIAADLFPEKVGNALGYLVGALVLGTAFPFLLNNFLFHFDENYILIATSLLALLGGLLVLLFVPRKKSPVPTKPVHIFSAFKLFQLRNFRAAAFGYFGHMWELYTFWALLPLLLFNYTENRPLFNGALWSFIIIAAGALGCVTGGLLSKKWGSKKVAFYSLLLSGSCCLLIPFLFDAHVAFFLSLMVIWGMTVVSDSPQFSAMVAVSAPPEQKGTAITLVTCIGFSITIISIQFIHFMFIFFGNYTLMFLAAGPALGLRALRKYLPAPKTGR